MLTEPVPAAAPAVGPHQRSRLQFGVRGILLLTALVAVWGTHSLNRRSIEQLQARLPSMRAIAAELTVADPSRISVIKLPAMWFDEQKWELFLPSNEYQLCLATEEVDEQGLAPVDRQLPLPQGRVRLELAKKRTDAGWQVTVLHDDQVVLTVDKPQSWDSDNGSSGGGHFDRQQEFLPDEQVILMRRRFMVRISPTRSQSPQGPAAGVLLWLEKPAADP